MQLMTALLIGAVFGAGLTISQMVNPAKVQSFLDVGGNWDPSLALVMGGALLVTLPAFAWLRKRAKPVLDTGFSWPARGDVDGRLVLGATLFGLGWGLAGFCPGPALASASFGGLETILFVAAMIVGTLTIRLTDRTRAS
jgi:uncharacterized membrane protein YedE/YeeE